MGRLLALTTLHVGDNAISSLTQLPMLPMLTGITSRTHPRGLIKWCVSVELHAAGNRLTSVHGIGQLFPQLDTLDISRNQLGDFDATILQCMRGACRALVDSYFFHRL